MLEGASGTTYRQIGFSQFIVKWEIEGVLVSRYDANLNILQTRNREDFWADFLED